MSVYTPEGRLEIAFVDSSTPGRFAFTFVSTLGSLSPPLPSGIAIIRVERDCVIRRASLLTVGGPGSCVVDVYKDIYANFPPDAADSICAAAKPTITAGTKFEDTALSGWTTLLNAGDVLAANLDSSTTFKKVVLVLEYD